MIDCENFKGVGDTLRRLRLQKGISQETLANRLGKKQTEISRLERQDNTSVKTLCKLSKALEIHPAEFITALVDNENGHGE
jgi:transcriptional regulator with XRE-family HTH domain